MSESRILRSRLADSIDVLDRAVSPLPSGSQKFLGTIVSPGSGVSLLADHYVSAYQTSIDGTEVEGGAATFSADTSAKILGIVLGLTPVAGDRLVFTSHDGRWIARKRGGGGVIPTPGYTACCPSSTIPSTLSISFAFGAPTNAATYAHQLVPATLTYASTPPSYVHNPFGGVTPRHYSPVMTDDNGNRFYYSTNCNTAGSISFEFSIPDPDVGAATPTSCMSVVLISCSPFLVNGVVWSGIGIASCIIGSIGGTGYNFGTTAGDSVTIS